MAVPQYDALMNPALKAIKLLGGTAHIRDIEEKVAELVHLNNEDLNDIHRGKTTKLSYRLAWSRNYLKRFGLLEKKSRGVWSLTEEGKNTNLVDEDEVKRKVKTIDNEP
jgi:restriction system protein